MSNNPANEKSKVTLPAGYQPMSNGSKKLEVPARDGYHRRWFRGDAGRIAKAKRAGYEFVDPSEVELNNFDLGGDAKDSGNTDMGSRVSVVSGDGTDEAGQPYRLYLMECPLEIYEYGRSKLQERNDSIADAISGGTLGAGQGGETPRDAAKRYTKGTTPDLFVNKNRS
jgi:hypothetical protein